MFYVSKESYTGLFNMLNERPPKEHTLERKGYEVLHDLNYRGVLKSEPIPDTECFTLKFVVVFRTARSNLIAVRNNSYAIPVDIEDKYPVGATFDDLILLHGKKFIDTYVTSTDISEFIMNTQIQPWGVVQISDDLYIPIEIVVKDEAIYNKLGVLNADFTDDLREDLVTDTHANRYSLVNGFTPLCVVKKFLFTQCSVFDICNCIKENLKEVKSE